MQAAALVAGAHGGFSGTPRRSPCGYVRVRAGPGPRLLHVQVLARLEVHDVHVEVVVRRLRQQLAQRERLARHRQHRLRVGRAVQRLRAARAACLRQSNARQAPSCLLHTAERPPQRSGHVRLRLEELAGASSSAGAPQVMCRERGGRLCV